MRFVFTINEQLKVSYYSDCVYILILQKLKIATEMPLGDVYTMHLTSELFTGASHVYCYKMLPCCHGNQNDMPAWNLIFIFQ